MNSDRDLPRAGRTGLLGPLVAVPATLGTGVVALTQACGHRRRVRGALPAEDFVTAGRVLSTVLARANTD
jgi:hypothetical protein